MNIHQLATLTGLTRGQIHQCLSRYNIPLGAKGRPGVARSFSKAEVFSFCVAGGMRRMGIKWPAIKRYIAVLPCAKLDEAFPSQHSFAEAMLILIPAPKGVAPVAKYIELASDDYPTDTFFMFSASAMARQIDARMTPANVATKGEPNTRPWDNLQCDAHTPLSGGVARLDAFADGWARLVCPKFPSEGEGS